ncbi:hypothetical protein BH24ACI3_BH24ACI3_14910 [soil metagenome]
MPFLFQTEEDKQQIQVKGIVEELRSQYLLRFSPAAPQVIKNRYPIKVRVDRPELFIVTRGSFVP